MEPVKHKFKLLSHVFICKSLLTKENLDKCYVTFINLFLNSIYNWILYSLRIKVLKDIHTSNSLYYRPTLDFTDKLSISIQLIVCGLDFVRSQSGLLVFTGPSQNFQASSISANSGVYMKLKIKKKQRYTYCTCWISNVAW